MSNNFIKQVKDYVNDDNFTSEVSFNVWANSLTGGYRVDRDCLIMEENNVYAILNNRRYVIDNKHRIEKAGNEDLIYMVFDFKDKLVLTLHFIKK